MMQLRWGVLPVLALVGACATEPRMGSEAAPDMARLSSRVAENYASWARRDFRSVYEMESPPLRAKLSYEVWLKDHRLEGTDAAKRITIAAGRIVESCGCSAYQRSDYPPVTRCKVATEVTTNTSGNPATERDLEMWEFVDGEWYHGYTVGAGSCGR